MEEDLRSRDRNEALLALDREMQAFRPYLGLSPDEALARSKTAPPAEKGPDIHRWIDEDGVVHYSTKRRGEKR